MDNQIGNRASSEHIFSRKGSGVPIRDADHNGKGIRYCNRLGCSTRHNYLKSAGTDIQERFKTAKPSLGTIRGKEKEESSCRPISAFSSYRKSLQEQKSRMPLRQSYTAESSSRQESTEYLPSIRQLVFMEDFQSNPQQNDSEDSESTSTYMDCSESTILDEISLDAPQSPIHDSAANCTRPTRVSIGRSSIGRHDGSSSAFARRPKTACHSFSYAAKPVALGWGAGTGTRSSTLKNLRCNSISDVFPSGCSSSGYSRDRTIEIARKKLPNIESSSARRKAVGVLSGSGSRHPATSGSRLSIPETATNQPVSRRTRDRPATRGGPASFRTRTSAAESRMTSLRGNDSVLNAAMAPQVPPSRLSVPEITLENSSRSFIVGMPNVFSSTSQSDSSNRLNRNRLLPHLEDQYNDLHTLSGSPSGRDVYQCFNVEAVAEMLLALERIEQDEELSYEQLLVLETSLLVGGLSFHDQHRDMRLDIDNMSYEELLALEEKMGIVSTALSEEQLSKSLTRSIYKPADKFPENNTGNVDDVKCSICQEEYVNGDELGNLLCKHRYHVPCIQHWLQQKNWCPICKSCARSS